MALIMTVYSRQIATAIRLLDKYGQFIKWRQIKDGLPTDIAQPWKPSIAAPKDLDKIKVAFFPNNRVTYESLRSLITGQEISTGNTLGYMASQLFLPSLKDTLIRNGKEYRLESISEINVDGSPILYILSLDM